MTEKDLIDGIECTIACQLGLLHGYLDSKQISKKQGKNIITWIRGALQLIEIKCCEDSKNERS